MLELTTLGFKRTVALILSILSNENQELDIGAKPERSVNGNSRQLFPTYILHPGQFVFPIYKIGKNGRVAPR